MLLFKKKCLRKNTWSLATRSPGDVVQLAIDELSVTFRVPGVVEERLHAEPNELAGGRVLRVRPVEADGISLDVSGVEVSWTLAGSCGQQGRVGK